MNNGTKKTAALLIALCLAFALLSGCIVKPEYLAESRYIPTASPVSFTPEPTAIPEPPRPTAEPLPEQEEAKKDSRQTDPAPIEGEEGYYYSFLTEAQKQAYREIKRALDEHSQQRYDLSTSDLGEAYIAHDHLMRDCAKYYYDDMYYYMQDGGSVYLFRNTDDFSWVDQELAAIDAQTDEILSSVPPGASEYETVKCFYEWLCRNISYEHSDRDQIIPSAFIDKKTVCAGYARALQYLCNRSGIQCAVVFGLGDNKTTPPEDHVWDLVRIDGRYYWVDATWGDPLGTENTPDAFVSYYFLCTTDEFLFRTHTLYPFEGDYGPDHSYSVPYPACEDESLLYSKQFGLFFDLYDRRTVENGIVEYLKAGRDPKLILQFKIPNDVVRFETESLPSILQVLRENGVNQYTQYQSVYYDRDGYIEIQFLP